MKQKRILKRILSILFVMALSFTALASCAKSGDDGGVKDATEAVSQDEQDNAEVTSEEATLPDPELPDRDFEGYEFRMLNIDQESMWWAIVDSDAEEEIGDPVNDAIYRRNRNIEEKYNITIKENKVSSSQVTSILKKNAQAGSDEYDIAFPATNQLPGIVGSSALVDLHEVPYLDFDKPWWNTSVRQYFSLNNKLYAMTSDFLLTDNENVAVLMYNKKLAETLGVESADELYAIVDSGKWTFGKFDELCKTAIFDLNGDGAMKGDDDRFGLTCCSWLYQHMTVGFGETITKKDANDLPVIACNTQRYIQAYETMVNFMYQRDNVSREFTDSSANTEYVFVEDRALFCAQVLSCVRLYKNMGSDFGLLPLPKLDEAQDMYYTPVLWSTCITVPTTNTNLERTGVILEALTAESRRLVIPAYYEVAIGTKYLRDEGSFRMLDIILSNQTYDSAMSIYNWGSFSGYFDTAATKGDINFTSLFEKYESKILAGIEKTLESYK